MTTEELRALWKKMDERSREDAEKRVRAIVVGALVLIIAIFALMAWAGMGLQ